MPSVNVAELRSRLSSYLERAQRGEEILIRNRKRAVARLVPPSKTGGFSDDLLELAAQGLLRLPKKRLDWKAFFALPAPNVPLEVIRTAIEAEREED
jgi:prevent-host-death family protein